MWIDRWLRWWLVAWLFGAAERAGSPAASTHTHTLCFRPCTHTKKTHKRAHLGLAHDEPLGAAPRERDDHRRLHVGAREQRVGARVLVLDKERVACRLNFERLNGLNVLKFGVRRIAKGEAGGVGLKSDGSGSPPQSLQSSWLSPDCPFSLAALSLTRHDVVGADRDARDLVVVRRDVREQRLLTFWIGLDLCWLLSG